jgi:hypothetical protein
MRRPTLAALCAVLAPMALTVACGGGSGSPTGPSSNPPVISSVSPNTGTSFGGTQVTISGTKFVAGMTVTFGGVPGVNVAVETETTIRATTPPHASGATDVQVSGTTGTGTLPQAFAFIAPTTANTPPNIRSLAAKGRKTNEPAGFADLNETIDVTAVVEDAETPVDKLTYQWAATAGTVSGTGPLATWTAPGSATTPVDVVITLTVVETYKGPDSTGIPVDKTNTVTSTTKVSLHNSAREIGDMAYDFMNLFSQSSITSPDAVLHNFTPDCEGYSSERADVTKNRAQVKITAYKGSAATVTLNFGGRCPFRSIGGDACAEVPWEWHSLVIDSSSSYFGYTDNRGGIDQVTAVYISPRWWLCASDWDESWQNYTK